jgi:hypothetical protein
LKVGEYWLENVEASNHQSLSVTQKKMILMNTLCSRFQVGHKASQHRIDGTESTSQKLSDIQSRGIKDQACL